MAAVQLELAHVDLDTLDGVPITDVRYLAAVAAPHMHVEAARTRPAYLARALAAGHVEVRGDYVEVTDAGQAWLAEVPS